MTSFRSDSVDKQEKIDLVQTIITELKVLGAFHEFRSTTKAGAVGKSWAMSGIEPGKFRLTRHLTTKVTAT